MKKSNSCCQAIETDKTLGTFSPRVVEAYDTGLFSLPRLKENFMGKGDKRTKKGKIKARSHGKKRPHKTVKKAAPKKS